VKFNSHSIMKTHPSRRKEGFTLIELLVVIAIIAVLAAVGLPAALNAMNTAKKVTATNTATSLESAITRFFSDYGGMPIDPVPASPLDTSASDGLPLLITLTGKETGNTVLNNRALNYLNVREGKAKKNGMIYDSNGVPTGLYDPWGGGYKVLMDDNFDDVVEPSPTGTTAVKLNGRKAAVWSEGADYKDAKKPADDVKTW